MYGLPNGFDGSRLIGRRLEQICFSENQLALHFDDELSVIIESTLLCQDSATSIGQLIEIPVSQSNLMRLLGRAILKSYGDDSGTLIIEFENGCILKCLDTSRAYESYKIIHGKEEIIV
jgi:hypothetical protein